jgi:hypothetical protein
MFLAGLNSIGLNLNSRRLARRAEYMDVFCTKSVWSRFTRHIPVIRPSGHHYIDMCSCESINFSEQPLAGPQDEIHGCIS